MDTTTKNTDVPSSPLSLNGWLLCAAFFAAGLLLSILPFFNWDLRFLPGNLDTMFNAVVLEHGYQWLIGIQKSFWDPPYFFPAPLALAYSDNHIGNLPLFALYRSLFSLETALTYWILSQFALNYLTCIWVLRKWRFSLLAACAGAYFFTFALPLTAQLGHIQLLPRFAGVLALYFIRAFWRDRSWQSFGAFLLFWVWQFACSIYLGSIFSLAIAAYLLLLVIMDGKRQNWRLLLLGKSYKDIAYRILSAATAAAVLWRLVEPYRWTWELLNITKPLSIKAFSPPQIWSYLLPNADSLLYHNLAALNPLAELRAEHSLFPGLAAIIALGAAVWLAYHNREHELTRVLLVIAMLVLFSVKLGPVCISGWCFDNVPGCNSLRAISRIILVLLFGGTVCIAFLIDHCKTRKYLQWGFLALLLADSAIISTSERFDPADNRRDEIRLAERMKNLPPGSVFMYVPQNCDGRTQLIAMRTAQRLGLLTVNGYSGHNPPGWFPWGVRSEKLGSDLRDWQKTSYQWYHTPQNEDAWSKNILVIQDLEPQDTPPKPTAP